MAAVLAGAQPRARQPVTWVLRLPYPVRNVLRRWRGFVGMILGVGIALGVTMTLLAVASASVEYYSADFKRSGADLYVVTQGGTLVPVLPSDTPGTIKNAASVLARLRATPGVQSAVGVMSWSMVREREGASRRDTPRELVVAVGVDGDPAQIPNVLTLDAGRWIRRSDEVVLGSRLSREKGLGVGSTIRLAGRDFAVVGVGKLRGMGAGLSADAVAYLDYRAFRQRADVGDVISIVVVDARQPELVRERLPDVGQLAAFSPQDLVRQSEEVNAAAMAIYWVLIGLTLAIATLFVGNMLNHSVAVRRLEFATLRAIGVPRRTILLTVTGEAILISVAALVVGTALSLLLGALLNGYVAPAYSIEFLYVADIGLFVVVSLLALGLGLVAGLVPARRATQVDPVEVLREA